LRAQRGHRDLPTPGHGVVQGQHQPDAFADEIGPGQVAVDRPRLVVVLVPHHDVEVLQP
jgi:hypothetical protein